MTAWRWVGRDVVDAIHDRQVAEHGGLDGVRDGGVIDSALAKPQNLAAYGDAPDVAALAAAYAFGLARNHGYVDGNKRTAWVTARLFLAAPGFRLLFNPIEAAQIPEATAVGQVGETGLAGWFRQRVSKPK